MRNKDRIIPILVRLGNAWAKVPDWRLGQLISNAHNGDLFFPEDEDLLKEIESMVEENGRV